jgi:hypothetical protein
VRPPLSVKDEALTDELLSRKPSELLPILLEVARRQSAGRRPADVQKQYASDPFVTPSPLDQREMNRFEAIALDAASDYEALVLSPLAPLGTCSVVSPTTQDRSVTTSRTTEVVSDPTNVLALECARRMLSGSKHVRLCTLHQTVRPQRYEKPGFTKHFRLLALAEAGASRPDYGFEVDAVCAHAAAFLRLFDACGVLGCTLPNRRATLHVAPRAVALGDRVLTRLREVHPDVRVDVTPLDSGYYDGLRLLIGAEASVGHVDLGDVGVFDWMTKLTSNGRMRFVAAGLGIQLLPMLFRSGT